MSSRLRFPTLFSYMALLSPLTTVDERKKTGDLYMRLALAAAVSCLFMTSLSAGENATAAITQETDIPPESLGNALEALARDRKLQLIYATDDVGSRQSDGAVGNLSTGEALKQILKGTGLSYEFLDEKTVTVQPAGGSPRASGARNDQRSSHTNEGSLEGNLRLAQANQGVAQSPSAFDSNIQSTKANSESPSNLEEILVTAQKQGEQRLGDVPVSISVVNTQELVNTNQVSIKDYYNAIPGLSIGATPSEDYMLLSIRGISTGSSHDPTVGVTIDDQPFGGFTTVGGGNEIPDLDPNDLARIEVLRGPQGTLYGANSMGGLIRYVTKDPTTAAFSGSVSAGTDTVYNGVGAGYSFRASANIPLTSELAVRVSGYTREDPGYIDDPVRDIDGINKDHANGGMLTAKWTPSDSVSLKVRALYQQFKSDGSSDINEALGDLQQHFPPPGIGGDDHTAQSYSAVLNSKLGTIDLTSVTGYSTNSVKTSTDYTYALGSFTEQQFSVPYDPFFFTDHNNVFSEELRLSGSVASSLEWLAGVFYGYEKGASSGYIPAESVSESIVANLLTYDTGIRYREYAAFATVTYHFTDRFNIQLGGRDSNDEENKWETDTGFFEGPSPVFSYKPAASTKVFTYLVTPQFKMTPDCMLYARVASGFRPGGANGSQVLGGVAGPPEYNSDKIVNYEFGIKADVLDHRLSVDASVYYIDWRDIQLSIQPPGSLPYIGNGSGAKSEGVELTLTSHPLPGLTLAGWVDYDDAALTQATPPAGTYGLPGFRLPFVSRWSGNASLLQEFPIVSTVSGFIGGQIKLIGDRLGEFAASVAAPERQNYPSYTEADLRAGAKSGPWTVNFYANNVTDRRALIGGGIGEIPPFALSIIQPRTVGLTVIRAF